MEIEKAIQKGAGFLVAAQNKSGSWPGYSSPDLDFARATPSPNIFNTALILGALADLPPEFLEPLQKSAREAVSESQKMLDFIEHYHRS